MKGAKRERMYGRRKRWGDEKKAHEQNSKNAEEWEEN
jgi:hypothetical protein